MTIRFEGEKEEIPGVSFEIECLHCPPNLRKLNFPHLADAILNAEAHDSLCRLGAIDPDITVTGRKLDLEPPKKPFSFLR